MNAWAHKNKQTGFTIVELLIVIIVIGILATLILVAYTNVNSQAKASVLKGDLNQAGKQLHIDKEKNGGGSYPATLAAANSGNGITPSSGATYTYYPNYATNPTAYCLQETRDNITYSISASGAAASAAASGSCSDAQGLIGWWKLNGNFNDASGNNNNGTGVASPAATADKNGNANSAYSLNGSSQYINLPAVMPTSKPYTKTVWFNTNSTAGSQNILSYAGTCGGHAYYLATLKMSTGHCGNWGSAADPTAVTQGTWYFGVVSYDPNVASGTINLYRNGAVVATATSVPLMTEANITIGAFGGSNYFSGSIDDVRLYNRALSAAEIAAMYTAGPQ